MKTDGNQEELELDIVNTQYWYDESDNFNVLLSYIKHINHSLSEQSSGLVLKSDKSLYTNDEHSYSLGIKLVISNIPQEVSSKIEILKNKVAEIIAWNKGQLTNNRPENIVKQHKMLFPLNILDAHWAALEVVLTFMPQEESFVLAKEITVNIYDSSSAFAKEFMNYSSRIHKMLDQALKSFAAKPEAFVYSGSWLTTKKQSDIYSCGPITCKNILDRIFGASIPNNTVNYTFQEIYTLRLWQLKVINDPAFTRKQQTNQAPILAAKVLNKDAGSLADAIYTFIDDPLSEVFGNVETLIKAERATRLVNYSDHIATPEELALNEVNYREQLLKIKKWFNANYDKLKEEHILQNFFKIPENKPAADDMEWVDNGTDKLIEVFEKLLLIANPNNAVNKKNTDQEEWERTLLLSEELTPNSLISGAMKVVYKNKFYLYRYDGNVTTSANGSGVHCNPWEENIDGLYSFKGELQNGLKATGDEWYKHSEFRINTNFVGTRDNNGKPLTGVIACFVGNKMGNDAYLLYEGLIEAGKFNGEAALYMVEMIDKAHSYPTNLKMVCNFDNDLLTSKLEVTDLSIGISSEEVKKNAKMLAKLQEAIDSDIIMIHLLMHAAEKYVIFPKEESEIFMARDAILSEYKPEPPKALKRYLAEEPLYMDGEESNNDELFVKNREGFLLLSNGHKKPLVSNSAANSPLGGEPVITKAKQSSRRAPLSLNCVFPR